MSKYTHFETSSNYRDVVNETFTKDIIFSEDNSAYGSCTADQAYDKPDKKLYVFSNTDAIPLAVMHGNNLVTPIRYRPWLLGYDAVNLVTKLTGNKTKDTLGVFIVEYININHYHDTSRHIKNIINYYEEVCSKMENRKQAENILEKVYKASTKGGTGSIRIVTYIPFKDILEKRYIFDPMSGLLICAGDLHDDVIHPYSISYQGMKCDIHNINRNTVSIEIIDNISGATYYTKIGNTTIPIVPTKDLTKPNGINITTFNNGSELENFSSELHEASDTLGIYRTKHECEAQGDLNNINLAKKHELESKKISLELDKVSLEYKKLEEEKERLITDRDYYKQKYEYEIIKLNLDLEINKQKYKIARIDYGKKVLDEDLMYRKHLLDITSYSLKIESDKQKARLEQEKGMMDFATKATGLVTTLLKAVS